MHAGHAKCKLENTHALTQPASLPVGSRSTQQAHPSRLVKSQLRMIKRSSTFPKTLPGIKSQLFFDNADKPTTNPTHNTNRRCGGSYSYNLQHHTPCKRQPPTYQTPPGVTKTPLFNRIESPIHGSPKRSLYIRTRVRAGERERERKMKREVQHSRPPCKMR